MAFRNFEDDYRSLKEVVFDLCKSYEEEVLEDQEEGSEIILINPPYEPLYIKTAVSSNDCTCLGWFLNFKAQQRFHEMSVTM